MKIPTRTRLAAATIAAIAAPLATVGFAGIAQADSPQPSTFGGAEHVVFVQTDNTAGNQVIAYDRSDNGTLTLANSYATGGLGGSLSGSVVDHLASQGSLTYDQGNHLLYAVNAGSNTVSVFSVRGDQLTLRQVVGSGGTFPVSVAVHNNVVYVLNAENGGALQEYFSLFGHLFPVPGSNRALGLDPSATPQFTNTPGQVAFSPDGNQLIVTTKANGNDIDVFGVGFLGLLSPSPVVNSEPNTVPFGVTFDAAEHLVVAESSSTNPALGTFTLNRDGTLTPISTVATGQAATCWVTPAQGYLFASNAGGPSVSGFQASPAGQLTLLGKTATDPGTVDGSASADGQFLYVQTGANGIVDEFHVNPGGSLTEIGTVTVPGAVAGEGIVAF
ncbi:MAG TPA: beta-propeller fold lactonase family protein [Acidimicrobiales bacterium]|nr:beta-propeller fold lactonase family protein [Acidimicrobiales bacterium]